MGVKSAFNSHPSLGSQASLSTPDLHVKTEEDDIVDDAEDLELRKFQEKAHKLMSVELGNGQSVPYEFIRGMSEMANYDLSVLTQLYLSCPKPVNKLVESGLRVRIKGLITKKQDILQILCALQFAFATANENSLPGNIAVDQKRACTFIAWMLEYIADSENWIIEEEVGQASGLLLTEVVFLGKQCSDLMTEREQYIDDSSSSHVELVEKVLELCTEGLGLNQEEEGLDVELEDCCNLGATRCLEDFLYVAESSDVDEVADNKCSENKVVEEELRIKELLREFFQLAE